MKEKSLINSVIKTAVIGFAFLIIIGQVEFDITLSKKRINIWQTAVDTGKNVYKTYKIVKGL